MSGPTFYLAYRGEYPYVPSVLRRCSRCGCRVWVDIDMLDYANRLPIVCLGCAEKIAGLA